MKTPETRRSELMRRLMKAQDHQTRDIVTIVYCAPVMTDDQLEAHVIRYENTIAACRAAVEANGKAG